MHRRWIGAGTIVTGLAGWATARALWPGPF